MIRRRVAAAALAVVLAACGSDHGRAPENAVLGGGAVARVGSTTIGGDEVARVAKARGIGARDAAKLLLDDAVAAEAARARGVDRSPAIAWSITAVLARHLAEHVRDDARAQGLPTDQEVADMTVARWRELDLPEQARVVHAVILRPDPPSPEATAQAQASAAAMQRKLASASSTDEFVRMANAFPLGALKLKAEQLPAFIADGRSAEGALTSFDATFTAAAFALKQSGDTSAVVETKFGWHVIRLIEKLPPKRRSFEERRAIIAQDVFDIRARKAREAILAARRARTPVQIAEGADQLMSEASADARHD